ncbi:MAG: hypothetical protein RSB71_01480 [Bacilli bacterium]
MSSSSIMYQIRLKSSSVTQLELIKQNYEVLLSKLEKVCSFLKQSLYQLKEADTNIKVSFTMDNKGADLGAISDTCITIRQKNDLLNNQIIPKIKSEIQILKQKISSLNSEISNLNRSYYDALDSEREARAREKSKSKTNKR